MPPLNPHKLPVGLCEPPIALCEVRRDGQCGPVDLVDQEVIAARKILGACGNLVGEIYGLLADLKILEHESRDGIEEEQ